MLKAFLQLRDEDRKRRPDRTRHQRNSAAIADLWKFLFNNGMEFEQLMFESHMKRMDRKGWLG